MELSPATYNTAKCCLLTAQNKSHNHSTVLQHSVTTMKLGTMVLAPDAHLLLAILLVAHPTCMERKGRVGTAYQYVCPCLVDAGSCIVVCKVGVWHLEGRNCAVRCTVSYMYHEPRPCLWEPSNHIHSSFKPTSSREHSTAWRHRNSSLLFAETG